MKHIVTVSLGVALLGCIGGVTAVEGKTSRSTLETPRGFLAKTVTLGDKTIRYVVYVPPVYDTKVPMPAIVFLNGLGECGTDGLKQISVGLGPAIMADVDAWPFIVLFPQKQDPMANWEDEDAMVMAIIKKTRAEYNIDPSRMYLTGLSQGGHGTWSIASAHPDMFAAIAPICGWGNEEIARKLATIPVRIFHGEADEAVPVQASKQMAEYLHNVGNTCELTIYPGVGHNSWDKAYREERLAKWFLEHRKSKQK